MNLFIELQLVHGREGGTNKSSLNALLQLAVLRLLRFAVRTQTRKANKSFSKQKWKKQQQKMRREEEQESRREEAVSVSCLEDKTNVWCTTKAPPKSFNYNQIEKTKKNKKKKRRKSRKIKPALMSYTHTHTGTPLFDLFRVAVQGCL